MKNIGRNKSPSPKVVQKYFDQPSEDSGFPLQDPIRFDPQDYAYRIWCGIHVLPAFLGLAPAQLCLAVAVIIISVLHLYMKDSLHALSPKPKEAFTAHHTRASFVQLNSSEVAEWKRFFFEPFEVLVYLRISLASVHVLGLCIGYFSVWKQKPGFLIPTIWTNTVVVVASFGYFILLTFHSVVQEDYFAFCFVGLCLLVVMVVNVLGAHASWELIAYLRDLSRFVSAARRRWPSVEQELKRSDSDKQRSGLCGCYRNLNRNYTLSNALISRATIEHSGVDNCFDYPLGVTSGSSYCENPQFSSYTNVNRSPKSNDISESHSLCIERSSDSVLC